MVRIGALALVAAAAAGWFVYRVFAARRVAQEADRLAEILAVQPASRIADIGAGDGEYSVELASRIVWLGHVFATEIDPDGVRGLAAAAANAGLSNVTTLQAREDSTNLPAGCCDAAFLRGVYHHLTKPGETNASLHQALRPGGRVAIIDFEPSWFLSTFFPVGDVPRNRGGHGISPEVVINEMQTAGFKLIHRIDDWPGGQYCLVFQRV
jgi:SAM-dependent methyltransferase